MATKKKTLLKGPRGPALRTITLRELIQILKGDQEAEIQVGRRSVIKYLEDKARPNIKF